MSGRPQAVRSNLYAIAAYVVLAVVFTWPLAMRLDTHLTGPVGGDTGVYVWNQWVFHKELVERGHQPYFTDRIFASTARPANLSLHNYTTFQNLLALPLMRPLGVVATFNVIYCLMTVLTAYAAFALARAVTGGALESWLAGGLFAWSPLMVARGSEHFSLVAAAPIPVFLLVLLQAARQDRMRDAVALGACLWWAASTDAYYPVYCLMIAGVYVLSRVASLQRASAATPRSWRQVLDVTILAAAGLIVSIAVSGGGRFSLFGQTVSMRSLHTPVLLLTCLVVTRACGRWRLTLAPIQLRDLRYVLRTGVVAAIVAAVMMSPVLYALGTRVAAVGFEPSPIFWRSSAPGLDLLAFLVPNPGHPLAPPSLGRWLAQQPNGYAENVASISFVAFAVLIIAWRRGWRPARLWWLLTAAFGLLALGPFIHVAGLNMHVPTPWALMRYLPIIGLARMPPRLAVVFTLGAAILFAAALHWLGQQRPEWRRRLLAITGGLLLFELLPSPRPLYSAAVPSFYATVAAAPGDVRVLHLPVGIRDGTQSIGKFSARTQFYQTAHGKPLLGGYLSRVSARRWTEAQSDPVLAGLILLSEGSQPTDADAAKLIRAGRSFVNRTRLGFVVIDHVQASPALVAFAKEAFSLRPIREEGGLGLYVPGHTGR